MIKSIKEDINSIYERDPAARSRWEVLLCYSGLHAVIIHRLANKLWKADWKVTARWLSQVGRFLTGIEIHPAAEIGKTCFDRPRYGRGYWRKPQKSVMTVRFITALLLEEPPFPKEQKDIRPSAETALSEPALKYWELLPWVTIAESAVMLSSLSRFPLDSTAVGNPARIVKKER